MDTYAHAYGLTGHYAKPGTHTSYCGRELMHEPNTGIRNRICTPCAKAEQRDRVEAEQVAADRAIGGPTLAQRAGVRYATVGTGRRIHYSNNDDSLCGREISEYVDGADLLALFNKGHQLCTPCDKAAEKRAYARSLATASPLAAAAVDLAETVEQADAEREQQAPAVHRFYSTGEAYDATQCRDDIRDGDVLIIERERVVGFLRSAWPGAITAEHGELHTFTADPRTIDDGRYALSVQYAEQIARDLEFELALAPALEQALAVEVAQWDTATRAADAVEYAEHVEAAVDTLEDAEALYAAQLVSEADADAGTWRGSWIGQQADDGLFALEPAVEQGALFDTAPAAVEVELERVDTVAPEVTRASVDAYLARTYPALFAAEQPQPAELEPAHMWAVEHRVVLRGDWQGLAMCGMSRKEADDRAGVLRATGSKAVAVVKCWHGPASHAEERRAARCQGCGYRVPTGTDWHDGCRPRPRVTPLERARRAAERDTLYARALEASDRVAALDGEPPF